MATLLVTAGPTREYIDDVRFLANASTGRMGYALAAAGAALGHRTILICGPTELDPPAGVEVDRVTSAVEMNDRARARFAEADVAIGAAAVADYTSCPQGGVSVWKPWRSGRPGCSRSSTRPPPTTCGGWRRSGERSRHRAAGTLCFQRRSCSKTSVCWCWINQRDWPCTLEPESATG